MAQAPMSLDRKPPKWLTREAKRIWRRVYRAAVMNGLYAEVDDELLARYCLLTEQLHEVARALKEATDEAERVKLRGQLLKLTDGLRKLDTHLGFSPAARAKIPQRQREHGVIDDPTTRRYFGEG